MVFWGRYNEQSDGSGFNLTKQFMILSSLCILLIGLVSTVMMSRVFTDQIITRDAVVSQEFVQGMIQVQKAWRFFSDPSTSEVDRDSLDSFFGPLNYIPDVVRANVYDKDSHILWSNKQYLNRLDIRNNPELAKALRGELIYELGIIGKTNKEEHLGFSKELNGMPVVETYIPVWSKDKTQVIGVVELYKIPQGMHFSIIEGQHIIWIGAIIGTILLFVSLYGIIRRASMIMEIQHKKLVETKSLSMIGETVSAVAHSMRNPLASIRASAELTLIDDLEGARESALDIISETDRLERWARELLQFSATDQESPELLDLNELVRVSLAEHKSLLDRRRITVKDLLSEDRLQIHGHVVPLTQVMNNLIMNSIEAMGNGGELTVSTFRDSRRNLAVLRMSDTGPGLSEDIREKLFQPFITTKAKGSGLGLALSRKLVEYYDGVLELKSIPGKGVTVTIQLAIAEGEP